MFKRLILSVGALLLMGGISAVSLANVPAPPVNQNIGIPDGVFNDLQRENCWYCHIPDRLTPQDLIDINWTFAAPDVKPNVITDRHHARVGTIVQDPTQSPNGVPGQPYECFSCHIIEWDAATENYQVVENFVDCLNCHTQVRGEASVHHLTKPAQDLNCQHCHGARIDNPGDGHYIPTNREPTLVTPRTSAGKGPNGEGACDFCHNTGVDAISGRIIPTNDVNHHSTGIGQPGISALDCTVCHDQPGTDWAIRRCQDCHGINSVHNIQADSNGDGVVTIGGEDPFFGHVGNSPADCNGCHGGYIGADGMAAPFAGPIAPEVTGLSVQSVTAGSEHTITVSGISLSNDVLTFQGTATVDSRGHLMHPGGQNIFLPTTDVTPSSMKVTIPDYLPPGNYYLRAVKGADRMSNPIALVVEAAVVIDSTQTADTRVGLFGKGFGTYMNAVNSGTSLTVEGLTCEVTHWADELIIADCGTSVCGNIEVQSIFGNATTSIACP